MSRFTDGDREEIRRRRMAGDSIPAIAAALDASPAGVRHAARSMGLDAPGHTGHVYKCSGWQPTERAERVFYVDAEGRRHSIPTSDTRDRGLRVGGKTVLQRWEHRACAPGDAAEWLRRHGWRRAEIPGRVWRSGNPAFRWVRDVRSV